MVFPLTPRQILFHSLLQVATIMTITSLPRISRFVLPVSKFLFVINRKPHYHTPRDSISGFITTEFLSSDPRSTWTITPTRSASTGVRCENITSTLNLAFGSWVLLGFYSCLWFLDVPGRPRSVIAELVPDASDAASHNQISRTFWISNSSIFLFSSLPSSLPSED